MSQPLTPGGWFAEPSFTQFLVQMFILCLKIKQQLILKRHRSTAGLCWRFLEEPGAQGSLKCGQTAAGPSSPADFLGTQLRHGCSEGDGRRLRAVREPSRVPREPPEPRIPHLLSHPPAWAPPLSRFSPSSVLGWTDSCLEIGNPPPSGGKGGHDCRGDRLLIFSPFTSWGSVAPASRCSFSPIRAGNGLIFQAATSALPAAVGRPRADCCVSIIFDRPFYGA